MNAGVRDVVGAATLARAVLVALVVEFAWRAWGKSLLASYGLGLVAGFSPVVSLGLIDTVAIHAAQPDAGWVFHLGPLPGLAAPFYQVPVGLGYLASYMVPLVCFLGCQLVLGGAARRRWGSWQGGTLFGLGWFYAGIAAQLGHTLAVFGSGQPSSFFPDLAPPAALFAMAPPWLASLVYPSGLLWAMLCVVSPYVGLMAWVGLQGGNRGL